MALGGGDHDRGRRRPRRAGARASRGRRVEGVGHEPRCRLVEDQRAAAGGGQPPRLLLEAQLVEQPDGVDGRAGDGEAAQDGHVVGLGQVEGRDAQAQRLAHRGERVLGQLAQAAGADERPRHRADGGDRGGLDRRGRSAPQRPPLTAAIGCAVRWTTVRSPCLWSTTTASCARGPRRCCAPTSASRSRRWPRDGREALALAERRAPDVRAARPRHARAAGPRDVRRAARAPPRHRGADPHRLRARRRPLRGAAPRRRRLPAQGHAAQRARPGRARGAGAASRASRRGWRDGCWPSSAARACRPPTRSPC